MSSHQVIKSKTSELLRKRLDNCFSFVIYVEFAKNLPKTDLIGKCDPYVTFFPVETLSNKDGSIVSSKPISNTLTPYWKNELHTAIRLDEFNSDWINQSTKITVSDHNKFTRDKILGKVKNALRLKQLFERCVKKIVSNQSQLLKRYLLRKEPQPSPQDLLGELFRLIAKYSRKDEVVEVEWKKVDNLELLSDHEAREYNCIQDASLLEHSYLHYHIKFSMPTKLFNPDCKDDSLKDVNQFIIQILEEECRVFCDQFNQSITQDIENDKKRAEIWFEQFEIDISEKFSSDLSYIHSYFGNSKSPKQRKTIAIVLPLAQNLRRRYRSQVWKEQLQKCVQDRKSKAKEKEETEISCERIETAFDSLSEAMEWRRSRLNDPEHQDEHVILFLCGDPHCIESHEVPITISRTVDIPSFTSLVGYRRIAMLQEELEKQKKIGFEKDFAARKELVRELFPDISQPEKLVKADLSKTSPFIIWNLHSSDNMDQESVFNVLPDSQDVFFHKINFTKKHSEKDYPSVITIMPRANAFFEHCVFPDTIINATFCRCLAMRFCKIATRAEFNAPLRLGPFTKIKQSLGKYELDDEASLQEKHGSPEWLDQMTEEMKEHPMILELRECRFGYAKQMDSHAGIHVSKYIRLSKSSRIMLCIFNDGLDLSGNGMDELVIDNNNNNDKNSETSKTDPEKQTVTWWYDDSEQCFRNINSWALYRHGGAPPESDLDSM